MSDSVHRPSPHPPTSWQSMRREPKEERATSELPQENSGELVLAADTGDSSHNRLKAVFRASEEGVVDLSRLLLSLSAVEQKVVFKKDCFCYKNVGPSTERIEQAVVRSIKILNSRRLVVGQQRPVVPAGVFAPLRRQHAIDLGQVVLDSNDTLEVDLDLPGFQFKPSRPGETPKEGVRYLDQVAISMAVPFIPSVARDGMQATFPKASIQCMEAATPLQIEASQSQYTAHLRFSFEEDGVVDLDSLQLSAVLWHGPTQSWDLIDKLVVQDFRLPDGRSLIIGNELMNRAFWNPAIPATAFSASGRFREWFQFGRLAVNRGQQISVTLRPGHRDEILNYSNQMCKRFGITEPKVTFSAAFRFFSVLGGHSANVSASPFFDHQPEGREAWHVLRTR